MPTYLSPGVYVQEVASGLAPISGVGTSTAGFIGVFAAAVSEKKLVKLGKVKTNVLVGTGGNGKKTFPLPPIATPLVFSSAGTLEAPTIKFDSSTPAAGVLLSNLI
ncbi:MAG: hypothetical protein F6K47_42225, partial [Symploca sp. SIO2E6]|nr:hypothetical protein [Symploca sp. SIO2E6]